MGVIPTKHNNRMINMKHVSLKCRVVVKICTEQAISNDSNRKRVALIIISNKRIPVMALISVLLKPL